MSEPGIKLSKSKVTQTIDLNKIVGSDISADELLVNRIGQAIIDYMDERVDDGKGLGEVKLKSPYSDSYAESLDFKAAGKSKSDVNMKLSGDMMGSIDLLKVDGSKLTIGIDDPDQAIKAYGHQTGFEGHPHIKGPKRPFFGVTPDEIKKKILPEFKDEIKAKRVTSAEEQNRLINFIRGIRTLGDLLK
jgi:phage gpG-like protein